MSESQRKYRVQHWLNEPMTDGAAADDDDESGYASNNLDEDQSSCSSDPSLRSDQSKGKLIDFKKLKENNPLLYQRWQSLQEQKKRLQIQEGIFLARLSPEQYQIWQLLQELRKNLQFEERFLADLLSDLMKKEEEMENEEMHVEEEDKSMT